MFSLRWSVGGNQFLFLVVFVCCVVTTTLASCAREKASEKTEASSTSASTADQVMTITTAPVSTREVKRTVEMVGTLRGWEEVTVSNEAPGTIEQMLVDLGDRVKKGQRLIVLDQREAKLALAQAEANLQAAQKAVVQAKAEWRDADLHRTRMKSLHNEGVVATSQLDIADARFDAIEAQVRAREADIERFRALVDLARKRVSDTEIVSPITGEVRQRLVSVGETIKDKTALLQLVIPDPLKLQGTVPERFAPDIKLEQPVDVQVEAFAERTFPGMILRISPAVEMQTRSLSLEAKIPNRQGLLKPGFFAKGLIVTGVNLQAVFVPEDAVYTYVGINKAFVVQDGTVQERQVKLGMRQQGQLEILDGLRMGETVATSSLAQLYQGAKVKVANGKPG